jgi:hypothetical protein
MTITVRHRLPFAVLALLAAVACGSKDSPCPNPVCPGTTTTTTSGPPPPMPPMTFVGAGDIALRTTGAAQTARLLDSIAERSSPRATRLLSWVGAGFSTATTHLGTSQDRTYPSPGITTTRPRRRPYFDYFGENAGFSRNGYTASIGAWHILSLTSASTRRPDRRNTRSSRAITTRPANCTLAYRHHPLFSSVERQQPQDGRHYRLLYDNNVDVVVTGRPL